ncbi:MAG TPA: hypothetical protein VIS99_06985 [Terrimicrobiaceae bacterium]
MGYNIIDAAKLEDLDYDECIVRKCLDLDEVEAFIQEEQAKASGA